MERLRERLEQAAVALATLEEVLHEPPSAIVRDASIQRFEYSFEAVWKAAQRYLRVVEGSVESSPKAVVRASIAARLLEEGDGRLALVMVDDRNLISHTYSKSAKQDPFPQYRQSNCRKSRLV